MSLAKAVQGGRQTPQQITWSRSDGTAVNLTGATLSGVIQPLNGDSRAITGTLTLTTAASGIFTWAYSAADVADAGYHLVQFTATFGSLEEISFTELWIVEAAL